LRILLNTNSREREKRGDQRRSGDEEVKSEKKKRVLYYTFLYYTDLGRFGIRIVVAHI
jgi:hypothetical protein